QWARRPSLVVALCEPTMGSLMVDMRVIVQRHQHVDVGQRDTHSSSRNRLTSSIVTFFEPRRDANRTTPLGTGPAGRGSRPRRAMSERAWPREVARLRASCLAADKTSSSRFTVVRIIVVYHAHHPSTPLMLWVIGVVGHPFELAANASVRLRFFVRKGSAFPKLDPPWRAGVWPFRRHLFRKTGRIRTEGEFLQLCLARVVAAKPEKRQARNAGDPHKAQGEAIPLCG